MKNTTSCIQTSKTFQNRNPKTFKTRERLFSKTSKVRQKRFVIYGKLTKQNTLNIRKH